MRKLGDMICRLNGKKSEVSIGDTYENLKIYAVISAVRDVAHDDKCRVVLNEYTTYLKRISDKAQKLLERGLKADEIIEKMLGNKKPRQESQRGKKKLKTKRVLKQKRRA
jgi:hypothetical protein